jgi:hypothetical protein
MTNFDRLDLLAKQHGTDKSTLHHGYTKYYAQHLPEKCRYMLEVGCERGRSALTWSDYYGNDELELHLVDLFENRDFVSPRWCRNRGFVPHICDQSDTRALYKIEQQFEVIIEDGSHQSNHQQITFKHLFQNNLKRGGLFVSEDLHCCKNSFYYSGYVNSFQDTFLYVLQQFQKTGKFEGVYFPDHEAKYFNENVSRVEIYDENIAFIWKR